MTATCLAAGLMIIAIYLLRSVTHGVHAWLVGRSGESFAAPLKRWCNQSIKHIHVSSWNQGPAKTIQAQQAVLSEAVFYLVYAAPAHWGRCILSCPQYLKELWSQLCLVRTVCATQLPTPGSHDPVHVNCLKHASAIGNLQNWSCVSA